MKYILLTALLNLAMSSVFGQIINPEINRDSLFQEILKDIPVDKRGEFEKIYRESTDESKEFLLFMLLMPRSSKKDLIDNYEQRKSQIYELQKGWNLDYQSVELAEMLNLIGWNMETLDKIKLLLDSANCISVENGYASVIGFARSGMGKYYYRILPNDIDEKVKNDYNDGCMFIYYKDNIVLEYGSGATGSLCFPDE